VDGEELLVELSLLQEDACLLPVLLPVNGRACLLSDKVNYGKEF